ncbi:MAG: AraC family transcriptional regulator [Eubacteriales bacterium]|nr:AraC family transcriptional regulator [Eubacteriales bacterium]
MDWVTGLQNAIDYMEEHLTEPLDYAEIAKRAYSSSFHFQRIFGILCGYTVGEYIRMRRLTLAGSALAGSDCRVVDVALRYGYDSPESFARAFQRFHGIKPSQARENSARLRSFSRLSVKLILEGGRTMEYRIEKKDAFRVIAKKERMQGGEVSPMEIQKLWSRCRSDGTIDALCRCMGDKPVFGNAVAGICLDNPQEGDFDYAIGVGYEGGEVPAGFALADIPAYTWVIFPCRGPMPEAFQELWKRIYSEFFPTSEYQPAGGLCLEVYPGDNVNDQDYYCEIWISAEKK